MNSAIDKIIASKRLPVLFIGSGISKRYLNGFPSWDELLKNICKQINISRTAYAAYIQDFKAKDPDISYGKLNQKLATLLHDKFLKKIQNEDINLETLFSEDEIGKCVNEEIDYFKMLVAKTFANYSIRPEKEEELNLLKKISSKISMVFTTNYDNFLQNEIFTDFKVYERQNKYYFRTNNGYGEIYKIHGCISDPNGIIICENDYQEFENSLKLVSSKLINALMDYPIIFLGYSLEDENIKKIIADFINSFDNDILQDIKKYIILVEYEANQEKLIEGEKQFVDAITGKNITLTTIKTDNFTEIFNHIDSLEPAATSYELRKYKTMIAELINKSAKGEKTVFVQEIDNADADITALYIGSKQTITNIDMSVNIYSNHNIIMKGLNNVPFDYDLFALKWYDNKCVKNNEYTPIFLIAHNMTIKFEQCSSKFKENYKNIAETFNKISNVQFNGNIDSIKNHYDDLKKTGKTSKIICDTVCIECYKALVCDKITPKECNIFLNQIINTEPQASESSPLRKAACYMWYRMYCKK